MSSRGARVRLQKLNKLNLADKSANAQGNVDENKTKRKLRSPKREPAASGDLTLDDFGGRSDALGG